jgi:hypothetical protein
LALTLEAFNQAVNEQKDVMARLARMIKNSIIQELGFKDISECRAWLTTQKEAMQDADSDMSVTSALKSERGLNPP